MTPCPAGVQPQKRVGGWAFRARFMFEGKVVTGPWRQTKEEASNDTKRMRKAAAEMPNEILTLERGIQLVLEDARKKNRTAGTIEFLENHFKALLRGFKANVPLHKISPRDIERYVEIRLQQHEEPAREGEKRLRKVTPSGVAADLRALSTVFKRAIKKGSLHRNPLTEAALPEVEERATLPLASNELRDILTQVRKSPRTTAARDADVIELLASTGIRLSEATRLSVADVDLATGTLHVAGKTGPRRLPISDHLRPLLDRLLAGRKAFPERRTDPLFTGGKPDVVNAVRRWSVWLKEPRLHPHALRASYATALATNGATAHQIQAALGHSNITMSARYVKMSGTDIAPQLAKLRFSGDPKPATAETASG